MHILFKTRKPTSSIKKQRRKHSNQPIHLIIVIHTITPITTKHSPRAFILIDLAVAGMVHFAHAVVVIFTTPIEVVINLHLLRLIIITIIMEVVLVDADVCHSVVDSLLIINHHLSPATRAASQVTHHLNVITIEMQALNAIHAVNLAIAHPIVTARRGNTTVKVVTVIMLIHHHHHHHPLYSRHQKLLRINQKNAIVHMLSSHRDHHLVQLEQRFIHNH